MRVPLVRLVALPVLLAACGGEPSGGYEPPAAGALDVVDETRVWTEACSFLRLVPEDDGRPLIKRYALPFLTIYDADGAAVYHQPGLLTESSVETWSSVADGTRRMVASEPPALDAVRSGSEAVGSEAAPDGADVTFVRYAADWCAPCKGQSAEIAAFRRARPDLAVAHIEVEADMAAWSAGGPPVCEATG